MAAVRWPPRRRKHLTSGIIEVYIRKAALKDLDAIKSLADVHKKELGFVLRPALASSIERDEMLVAENSRGVVGFVEYHHRQDEQTTLYHIAVCSDHRRQGIGQRLVEVLINDAVEHSKRYVLLRCPVYLEANRFYARLGFSQIGVDPGKQRQLIVWRLLLSLGTHDMGEVKD